MIRWKYVLKSEAMDVLGNTAISTNRQNFKHNNLTVFIKSLEFKSDALHITWRNETYEQCKTYHQEVEDVFSESKETKYLASAMSVQETKSIFHAMWLRDNDQGSLSRHPINGQRLFNLIDDVPDDLYIKNARIFLVDQDNHSLSNQVVHVCFGGDAGKYLFEADYDAWWLWKHDYCNNKVNLCSSTKSWNADKRSRATESINPKQQRTTWVNDNGFSDLHRFVEPDRQLWDKRFFQDEFNEEADCGFRNGLKFHDYKTLVAVDNLWKRNRTESEHYGNCSIRDKIQNVKVATDQNQFRPLLSFLEDFVRYGFTLIDGLPIIEGSILQLPALFGGYVRETNYGSLFDVRVEKNPNNLAFTNLAVTPHTSPSPSPLPR